jgi:sigma-B regulation protein RsbU (phosphoserine phosphatase)
MQLLDISHNPRISRLTQLTHELDESRSPEQTFAILRQAFCDVDGFVATLFLSTADMSAGRYRVLDALLEPGAQAIPRRGTERADFVCSGGILATIIARAEPQLLQDVDWSCDPNFHRMLAGYTSVIAIPLVGAHLPMSWAILLRRRPDRFTELDFEEILERTTLASALLENQSLAGELARANELIVADAQRVGEIQRSLLPAALPRIAGLEIAASYQPCDRAGGDVYDFFPLSPSDASDLRPQPPWSVFIGDASGHGLAAAVVTAIVQAVLRASPARIQGPASLLKYANEQLCARPLGGYFTAFLGIYEPTTRQLSYSNAGHPPPLLRRASHQSLLPLKDARSYPLGIDPAESFEQTTVQLERGDTLLLYTDGITEAIDAEKNVFGDEGLLRAMVKGPGARPAELVDRIRAAIAAHARRTPPIDDQTLVAALVL